jgi:ABC-type antimicrobial peptide transport system permease subunit
MPCRVAIIGNDTYGKFPKDAVQEYVLMEYNPFFTQIARYLPPGELQNNRAFKQFVAENGTNMIYQYSDFIMMTLPDPRVMYYSSNDYFQIQRGVTGYANQVIESLGFFPLKMNLDLLKQMEKFSQAILFLGLVFDIILLLFVILSILLIYSLLMISVEAKTFEFGIMRMVGLSKTGIVNMVLIQSMMFVLPSVIMGFVCSWPSLA